MNSGMRLLIRRSMDAYVPRTEEIPGPKKMAKKSSAGTSASGNASAEASSPTFAVPNTGMDLLENCKKRSDGH